MYGMGKGFMPAATLNLDEGKLATLYNYGITFYNNKKFEDASNIFQQLTCLDPSNNDFLFSLNL